MATKKITDLTELTSAASGDVLPIVDISEDITKKITTSNLASSLPVASLPSGIDAAKIGSGAVSNTEFGYLDGVTSAVQTQIDAKISKSDGTTYDINALAAVTQAEYDALTPSATTLYFII